MTNPADTGPSSLLQNIGRGLGLTGRALGAGASAIGRSAAWAYRSVDPDLRRQAIEAPVVGLMNLVPSPGADPRGADALEITTYQRDVILVHGWSGHPSNLRAIQRYFTHATSRRAHAVDLRRAGDLDAMARELRQEIARRASRSPSQRVDLIAHSMGGLVCRLALEDPATRDRVATLITMATPHEGSHLARLAATPFTLDLRPGSPMMERLAAQSFWRDGDPTRLVSLWSDADTTILPATSARWEPARSYHMDNYTHLTYLVSPASWRFLDDLLRQTTPNLTGP